MGRLLSGMVLALLFTSGPAKAENYTLWGGTELRFRLSRNPHNKPKTTEATAFPPSSTMP